MTNGADAATLNRMITSVKFVGIPVHDQERALAFYREKLGFKVATDQPMGPGQRWIELRIGGAETRVVLFTPKGHEERIGTFFNGSVANHNMAKKVAGGEGEG